MTTCFRWCYTTLKACKYLLIPSRYGRPNSSLPVDIMILLHKVKHQLKRSSWEPGPHQRFPLQFHMSIFEARTQVVSYFYVLRFFYLSFTTRLPCHSIFTINQQEMPMLYYSYSDLLFFLEPRLGVYPLVEMLQMKAWRFHFHYALEAPLINCIMCSANSDRERHNYKSKNSSISLSSML